MMNCLHSNRFLLLMTLVIALLPTSFIRAQTEKWIDKADTDWYTNDPTKASFTISSEEQLAGLAKLVNDGNNFAGKNIILGKDINLGNHLFTPIGFSKTRYFGGNFDGGNKVITNLRIDQSGETGAMNTGLFGYVRTKSHTVTIKNLILRGGEVKGGGSGGGDSSHTGALIGYIFINSSEVTLTNCHTLGIAVSGSTNVGFAYTGGLVGFAKTLTITSCSNSSTVTGGGMSISHTGGLIGHAIDLTMTSCLNNGAVTGEKPSASFTGGLTGYTKGSIINSYNAGAVRAEGGYVGGLAGYIELSAANGVANCWSSGSVTGGTLGTGGLVGRVNRSGGIISFTNCLAIPAKVTGNAATHRIAGENFVNAPAKLANNYAYVPEGTWTDKGHDKPNGADWDGLMTSPPIGGAWKPEEWIIDPTHTLMPKIKTIDVSLQPNVKNPLKKTLTPGPSPNPNPVIRYKVNLSLLLDNPALASCVTLYPGEGEYEVEARQNMTVLVFLNDDCDLSDVKMTVNGDTIIAEEKKNELRAIAYTFRISVNGHIELKVIGVQRNNTISTTPQASEGGAKVWTSDGHIHVRQAESRKQEAGGEVRIYTITGQLVVKESMPSHLSPLTFHLPKGIYLLVIGDEVCKVQVD